MVAYLQYEYIHNICLTGIFVVYLIFQEAPVFFIHPNNRCIWFTNFLGNKFTGQASNEERFGQDFFIQRTNALSCFIQRNKLFFKL